MPRRSPRAGPATQAAAVAAKIATNSRRLGVQAKVRAESATRSSPNSGRRASTSPAIASGQRSATAGKPTASQAVKSRPSSAATRALGAVPMRVPMPPTLAEKATARSA